MHRMEEMTKCELKIEVIDETAVIETTSACEDGNSRKEKGFLVCAEHYGGSVDINVLNQETDGKKEKRTRRRGKGARKHRGTDGQETMLIHTAEVQNGFRKKAKTTYSRKEMEALRFVNLEAQQKKWAEVYCGLGPNVAKNYDGLIDCNNQKHIQIDFDPRQQFGKKEKKIPGVFGMAAAKGRGNHLRIFVKTPEYPLFGLMQIAGQIVYSACIQSMVILYELAACAKSWCAVV